MLPSLRLEWRRAKEYSEHPDFLRGPAVQVQQPPQFSPTAVDRRTAELVAAQKETALLKAEIEQQKKATEAAVLQLQTRQAQQGLLSPEDQKRLNELTASVKEKELKLGETEQNMQRIIAEKDRLTGEKVGKLQQEVWRLQNQLAERTKETGQLKNDLGDFTNMINEKTRDIVRLRSEIQAKDATIKDITSQNGNANITQATIDTYDTMVSELKKELELLRQSQRQKDDDIKQLQADLNTMMAASQQQTGALPNQMLGAFTPKLTPRLPSAFPIPPTSLAAVDPAGGSSQTLNRFRLSSTGRNNISLTSQDTFLQSRGQGDDDDDDFGAGPDLNTVGNGDEDLLVVNQTGGNQGLDPALNTIGNGDEDLLVVNQTIAANAGGGDTAFFDVDSHTNPRGSTYLFVPGLNTGNPEDFVFSTKELKKKVDDAVSRMKNGTSDGNVYSRLVVDLEEAVGWIEHGLSADATEPFKAAVPDAMRVFVDGVRGVVEKSGVRLDSKQATIFKDSIAKYEKFLADTIKAGVETRARMDIWPQCNNRFCPFFCGVSLFNCFFFFFFVVSGTEP